MGVIDWIAEARLYVSRVQVAIYYCIYTPPVDEGHDGAENKHMGFDSTKDGADLPDSTLSVRNEYSPDNTGTLEEDRIVNIYSELQQSEIDSAAADKCFSGKPNDQRFLQDKLRSRTSSIDDQQNGQMSFHRQNYLTPDKQRSRANSNVLDIAIPISDGYSSNSKESSPTNKRKKRARSVLKHHPLVRDFLAPNTIIFYTFLSYRPIRYCVQISRGSCK